MRHRKRAIHAVAWLTQQVKGKIEINGIHISHLASEWSGQLRNLGSLLLFGLTALSLQCLAPHLSVVIVEED